MRGTYELALMHNKCKPICSLPSKVEEDKAIWKPSNSWDAPFQDFTNLAPTPRWSNTRGKHKTRLLYGLFDTWTKTIPTLTMLKKIKWHIFANTDMIYPISCYWSWHILTSYIPTCKRAMTGSKAAACSRLISSIFFLFSLRVFSISSVSNANRTTFSLHTNTRKKPNQHWNDVVDAN